jgi:glycosyltransferase involved in cell wall biosynthesis
VSFLSLIIPTYNRVSLLVRALESVLSQNTRDCEVIVIDDGSTDSTEEAVRSFPSVRYERQVRQGPGPARNLGWSLAMGEYIAFLDSDDIWFPWTFETFRTCIQKNPSTKFAVGTYFPFYEEAELKSVKASPLSAVAYRDFLTSADDLVWVGAGGMLLRHDCQPRFDSRHMNREDLDLSLHLGVEEGFVAIERPFTFAYRHYRDQGCNTCTDFDRTYRGILHVISEEKSNRFPGGPARRWERLKLITRSTRPPTLEALRYNHPMGGFDIYWQTLAWNASLRRWKFIFGFPLVAMASLPKLAWQWAKGLSRRRLTTSSVKLSADTLR